MNLIQRYLHAYIDNLKSVLSDIDLDAIEKTVLRLLQAREEGRQVFIIGNGGSASTASHMACDLAKGTIDYSAADFKRFRAVSLADNVAVITAIGNDLSYEDVFVEQLKNYLNAEDVVVVITASGNSPNIIKALQFARERGACTIGLLGFGGGKALKMVDLGLVVPSKNYGISEDFQMIMDHVITQILCRLLHDRKEKVLFLDRDGVINEKAEAGEYVTDWEDFRFKQGISELLVFAQSLGYKNMVISNQQCVGRGLLKREDLDGLHRRMIQELQKEGAKIDRVYYCPHLAGEGCSCRKPKPGLLYEAMNELTGNIEMDRSFLVGDEESDIVAGKAFGVKTILLREDRGITIETKADYLAGTLKEVTEIIRG